MRMAKRSNAMREPRAMRTQSVRVWVVVELAHAIVGGRSVRDWFVEV